MADVDVPLLGLEQLHQLGGEPVRAQQQQGHPGWCTRRIELRLNILRRQQLGQTRQMPGGKRLAKQHQPGAVQRLGNGQQGLWRQLPPGGAVQALWPLGQGSG